MCMLLRMPHPKVEILAVKLVKKSVKKEVDAPPQQPHVPSEAWVWGHWELVAIYSIRSSLV